ncbi:hypothetical protein [Hydrogenophaga atypica]|uniref:SMODS and SLOG-associating 2TM effector domain-containing protein n=1 Tax=Hydrogenophaga atypica TaxID=249409 RepID=A0ABW2QI52_9BURK
MTEIDVAEFNSREAAKFSLANLDVVRTRAHQLLLLLLGGGAGMGALGLERWHASPVLAGALLGAALLWFVLARQVARQGLVSSPVKAWAQAGLVEHYGEWQRFNAELAHEGKPTIDPLAELRKASLRATDRAAADYRTASAAAYAVVDNAYKSMVTTPVAALLGAGAAALLRRFM